MLKMLISITFLSSVYASGMCVPSTASECYALNGDYEPVERICCNVQEVKNSSIKYCVFEPDANKCLDDGGIPTNGVECCFKK